MSSRRAARRELCGCAHLLIVSGRLGSGGPSFLRVKGTAQALPPDKPVSEFAPHYQEISMIARRQVGSCTVLGIALVAILSYAMADENAPKPKKPQADAAADKEQKDLSHFMRAKLEASGKVLEGLAVEDFALIKEGAKKLNEISTAEKWRVSNDALYRNFSDDFQRVTKDLMTAAEEENLDRAALKWMDATMSCIECHRYARGVMIASRGFTTPDSPEAVR